MYLSTYFPRYTSVHLAVRALQDTNFIRIGERRCGSVSVDSTRDKAINEAAIVRITRTVIGVPYQCLNFADYLFQMTETIVAALP